MTLTELRDNLSQSSRVLNHTESTAPEMFGYQTLRFRCLVVQRDVVVQEHEFRVLLDGDNVFFLKRYPEFLLYDDVREPLISENDIKNKIEADNETWNVLSVNVHSRGDQDRARITVDDGTGVTEKTYAIYEQDYIDWYQPAGAHDAIGLGVIVLFEGDYYKSLNSANVWSPTDAPAEWEQVDITVMQPFG